MTIQQSFKDAWECNLDHHITNACNVFGYVCNEKQHTRIFDEAISIIDIISSKLSTRDIHLIPQYNSLCEQQILDTIKRVLNVV